MGNTSQNGTKILITVLSVTVIGLSIALFMITRPPAAPAVGNTTQAPPPGRAARDQGGGFGQVAPSLRGPSRPPALARNALGQPLDENGRPIGPPDKLARIRNKPIEPGALPITPPLFSDPAQRAAFKRWWVDELGRRASIYQQLEAGPAYPAPEETARLLDAFYDASEPRAPGESVEQALARRKEWRDLWKRFLSEYGATPQTISSRGGDPQYGETPAPPVQPPGVAEETAPPAPPALDAPPGRGAGEASGPVPGEEGTDRAER